MNVAVQQMVLLSSCKASQSIGDHADSLHQFHLGCRVDDDSLPPPRMSGGFCPRAVIVSDGSSFWLASSFLGSCVSVEPVLLCT